MSRDIHCIWINQRIRSSSFLLDGETHLSSAVSGLENQGFGVFNGCRPLRSHRVHWRNERKPVGLRSLDAFRYFKWPISIPAIPRTIAGKKSEDFRRLPRFEKDGILVAFTINPSNDKLDCSIEDLWRHLRWVLNV
ncbi:hypothetical protein KM043_014113 [Ampulex compressa]|nr:hypothetical protein KM043_014113 [Ampulex compressa]